jgi:outer membrane protein, multidrug efflux system
MRRTVSLMIVLSLGACSMDPHLGPVPVPVPASWPIGDAYLRQSEAPLPSYTYQDVFRDARLQSLVTQALANNRDLMVAAANIEAARAQVTITRANQFPTLDANGRATVSGGSGSGTTQN